jgi:hypothetical protein
MLISLNAWDFIPINRSSQLKTRESPRTFCRAMAATEREGEGRGGRQAVESGFRGARRVAGLVVTEVKRPTVRLPQRRGTDQLGDEPL